MCTAGWGRAILIFALCVVTFAAGAQFVTPEDIAGVYKTMDGPNFVDNPRSTTNSEGFLTYVGAPRGNAFEPSPSTKSLGSPEATAKAFLMEHARAFGILNAKVDLVTDRVKQKDGRTYVRLNQYYDGLPVFGGQVTVQMNDSGGVECILSNIMRQAGRVYSGALSLSPSLTGNQARNRAVNLLRGEFAGVEFTATSPELKIFVPYIMGMSGAARLVWQLDVSNTTPGEPVRDRLLLDAHSGSTVIRYSLIHKAKNRQIYDANSTSNDPGTLARAEGDPPSAIADVNDAYEYYGDTYDFYFNEHGRDSINGNGLTMSATVRFCPSASLCPFRNAFWDPQGLRMYFGQGFAVDDVVAHELTHGVTQFESNLIYFMESGAINESFSDIWGEFVDLVNQKGNDNPNVRWLMGEEIPSIGAIRNMKNPPQFGDPDRYKGPGWITDPFFDNGGVHINSGVGNKLCYLLTDGDTFNGFIVNGMGISKVADLFYECQTNLLNASSNYPALGDALIQAASNLGMTDTEIENVYSALFATEIKKFEGKPLRHFRATGRSGESGLALTWANPTVEPFTGVDIVRRTDRFPTDVNDGTFVGSVTDGSQQFLDNPGVSTGANVYYGLFARTGSLPLNVPLFTRGTVGVDMDYLSEAFTNGTDLSFTQITFTPTGDALTSFLSDRPTDHANHRNYTATVSTGTKISPSFDGTLPVPKEDIILLPMADDGAINLTTQVPIPFFGEFLSQLTLSANGFISGALSSYSNDPVNVVPTFENHFETRRISFLFCDLDPRSGGEVWAREMDDRLVVTFENVPSFDQDALVPGQSYANTVQCELFYGGQIRMTYLGLTAKRAVVGLSDGRGVPFRAADLFAGDPNPQPEVTNLNALPPALPLEILPVPIQMAEIGDTVTFTVAALSSVGAPQFSMTGAPPGATLNANTGNFSWNTSGFAEGAYTFAICANAGGLQACQSVTLFLFTTIDLPVATNLKLTPASPRDGDDLQASYTYSHPSIPEGPTFLYWFQNNVYIPAFTNQLLVPKEATKVGDFWYFMVLPSTAPVSGAYLRGNLAQSPIRQIQPDLKVDMNGDGKVNSVDLQLVVGSILGTGHPDIDGDVNGDGLVDATDVQSTVNYILTNPRR